MRHLPVYSNGPASTASRKKRTPYEPVTVYQEVKIARYVAENGIPVKISLANAIQRL